MYFWPTTYYNMPRTLDQTFLKIKPYWFKILIIVFLYSRCDLLFPHKKVRVVDTFVNVFVFT